MNSPSAQGKALLSNPSDEELSSELSQLPEATSSGIRAIRKLLKERHPHWELSESRVRQAWNALKEKRPTESTAAGSDSDRPALSFASLSSHGILQAVAASAEFLPHFVKKQVATMAFFCGPGGDINLHEGEREEKYRALYEDMTANTELWMNFLDQKSNYRHAENICGILVSVHVKKRCLKREVFLICT